MVMATTGAGAQSLDLSKIYRQQRTLVIGINTYGGGWPELRYARGDAEAAGRKLALWSSDRSWPPRPRPAS